MENTYQEHKNNMKQEHKDEGSTIWTWKVETHAKYYFSKNGICPLFSTRLLWKYTQIVLVNMTSLWISILTNNCSGECRYL